MFGPRSNSLFPEFVERKPARDRSVSQLKQRRLTIRRLLIVDDHLCVAEALAKHLANEYQVVGVLRDHKGVLPWMAKHYVDLVLLDGTLQQCDISDLIRRVAKKAVVIVMSMYPNPSTWRGLHRMGARGVVSKAASLDEFTEELARIAKAGRAEGDDDPSCRILEPSSRQLEIISRMAGGDSAKQIAATLGLSVPRTNEVIGQLHRLLGCRTWAQIVILAVEHGWIEPRIPDGACLWSGRSLELPQWKRQARAAPGMAGGGQLEDPSCELVRY